MASGNSTKAYGITSSSITDAEFDKLDKHFGLMDSLQDIENGGNIQKLLLFFAIEDTTDNVKDLQDVFGRNWGDYFKKRWYTKDGTPLSEGAYHWFITMERVSKLTGREASLLAKHVQMSAAQDSPDCWGDMIVAIIIVVVVTYATAGSAGPSTMALVLMWFQIAMVVTRTEMTAEMGIIMAVMSLGAGGGWSAMSTSAQVIAVAGLAIQGMTMYDDKQAQKKLTTIEEDTKKINEKYNAEFFERNTKFEFDEMFHYSQRSGHEKDPYYGIRDKYAEFSLYGVGGGSHWIQKE